MNSSESRDEFFFEFFSNRPILFGFYFSVTLAIFTLGTFLNSMIILVKLKKCQNVNGFDVLTINMAVTQIFISLSSLLFLVDEVHYKISHHSWCGLKFYSHTFSILLLGYSTLATLLVSLYARNPSKLHGIIPVIIVWILSIAFAYPSVDVALFEVPLSTGKKFICVMKFNAIEEVKNYRTLMTVMEFLAPSSFIISSSILACLFKSKEIQMRNFLVYPMILGIYFIISSSYISLVDFLFFYAGIQIKMPLYTSWKLFFSTISIVNAVAFFWIDQNFLYRCLQFLRLDEKKGKIFYFDMKNEKEEDPNNLGFERI